MYSSASLFRWIVLYFLYPTLLFYVNLYSNVKFVNFYDMLGVDYPGIEQCVQFHGWPCTYLQRGFLIESYQAGIPLVANRWAYLENTQVLWSSPFSAITNLLFGVVGFLILYNRFRLRGDRRYLQFSLRGLLCAVAFMAYFFVTIQARSPGTERIIALTGAVLLFGTMYWPPSDPCQK